MIRTVLVLGAALLAGCVQVLDGVRPVYDLGVAARGDRLVELTNGDALLLTPGSRQWGTFSAYACSGVALTDPDMQCDAASDRCIAVVIDGAGTGIDVAVAWGADPMRPYACRSYDPDVFFGGIDDQPRLSITGTLVTVTTQQGSQSATLAIAKADVLSDVWPPRTQTIPHGGFVLRPARNVAGDDPLWLVGSAGASAMRVGQVSGTWPALTVRYATVSMPWGMSGAGPATDPAGVAWTDFGAPTMHAAKTSGALITLTRVPYGLGLAELDGWPPVLSRSWVIWAPDGAANVVCPSLAADPQGDVVVGFAAAGPSRWLSAYVAGRRNADGFRPLRGPVRVVTGDAPLYPDPPGTIGRMDYCDAASMPGAAWLAVPYQKNTGLASALVLVTAGGNP